VAKHAGLPTVPAHTLLLLLLVPTQYCFGYNSNVDMDTPPLHPRPCYVDLEPKVSVTLCMQTGGIPEASFSYSGGGG
jgi:hypothetical protein